MLEASSCPDKQIIVSHKQATQLARPSDPVNGTASYSLETLTACCSRTMNMRVPTA